MEGIAGFRVGFRIVSKIKKLADPRFAIGPRGTWPGVTRFSFAAIPQPMAGFGAAVDDPRRPAGEHHEHSGACNQFLSLLRKLLKGRASSASA